MDKQEVRQILTNKLFANYTTSIPSKTEDKESRQGLTSGKREEKKIEYGHAFSQGKSKVK